ncbi:3-oxoacid CoA-transferase subunit A [Actinomadura sp. B10D3]|uniref:3-oxoacid CoA-transferase subunit A n=1 Tax=Actinomadura sp. B10D3 TaxID=3153557 RepID=UPI00325F61E7
MNDRLDIAADPDAAVRGVADGSTVLIGAFYTPTGAGTLLAEGKETRMIDGREHVLEHPIRGDVALIRAHRADRMGNLVYRETARNFGPVMATAAALTVVEVEEVVPIGDLDPEAVATPSIHVDRVVVARRAAEVPA